MKVVLVSVVAVLGLGLLPACSEDERSTAPTAVAMAADEVGAHTTGGLCPDRLPVGDDPGGHGFGVDQPATAAPDLPDPDGAQLCRYSPTDIGTTSSGGVVMAWDRDGPMLTLGDDELASLEDALHALVPPPDGQACTDDLGPRWLLVLVDGDDLTGVLVDDYGCRAVRLTDEPFSNPPGEASQPGTVPGVLQGPEGLVPALRGAYSSMRG